MGPENYDDALSILALRIDPAVQERVNVLAEKANEGLLTEAERAEYETFINADDCISLLKLKARQDLHDDGDR